MKIDPGMINDLFPFLLFSIIFAVALIGSYFSLKKQKEKMRDIALKLGLEFSQTDPLSFMGQGKPVRPAYHRPRDAGIDLQGLVKKVVSGFSPWRVAGKYHGYKVIIRTEKKDKKSFTVVQLLFSQPLGMGLNIVVGNFLSKMGKNIFGKQSISTGNPDLDNKVYISGQDEMKIKYLVKRSEFQQTLLSLYNKYPGVRVDDQGITYREKKVLTDLAAYQKLLDSLSAAAKAFAE
ncbi:MAG: hypothetical protein A2509_09965 [Candidatus Edwardsbacteria bacterium RIFOXYD12_FULL_50_11]|uniref:Uncharacterized protein n=1 Tax=Candidatus Edwardsbacteria bacterium GWF2_54_11 TaxID=1817851 RepID=A0A1F5R784_9BACT|nr:MAG: hypothetical protein A2502_11570 [Candidatus Edwardsbacteria bacterium RifOxyC12_full_54_24]OGF08268.1 MAG: hypothetical protein A2273_07940 [Candidatus Edwardsbacteria bacterium RifOxyA12_full_54_48]OGF10318.1 MAG: hypothetical protein A2024_02185 [Candidatus Edwardsbacteria bacterium GWF2_54_11]OGF11565.1 MAG: hypothetical protein A3K15_04410 [Candidatus Edwardsbacteria bacterium GWE2_54_12]OGF17352.1 MAG: hypothetical protein A2509_09965 [Candidatus Edwardsbacteria bacterium RIFOXYD1